MRVLVPILISVLSMAALPSRAADPYCKRRPLDPDLPAGIAGTYELIGKHSDGPAYSGTLTLDFGKSRYRVVHLVKGRATNGTAWISECGMDKIRELTVRLETKPVTEMSCMLGGDGNNYYRMTCRTTQGIEAWFQQPE